MNIALDFNLRRRWTPYKIVGEGALYRVFYLEPREALPPKAILFLIPLDSDGEIEKVRDAAANLLFHLEPANAMPA